MCTSVLSSFDVFSPFVMILCACLGLLHSKIPAMGGFAWNGLPLRAFLCILFGSNFAFVSVSQPKQFCLTSKKKIFAKFFFLDFFNVYLLVADTR